MSPIAPPSPGQASKLLTPFKVKPTAALMPEEKSKQQQVQQIHQQQPQPQQQQTHQNSNSISNKQQSFKKKNRKSPAGSPHPPQTEQQTMFNVEQTAREEVQSPAYSDISDDGAPVIETEDKTKSSDKKTESGQGLQHMPQYGMYPFYAQPQYLVPQEAKAKENEKAVEKPVDKENKKEGTEYPQKMLPQHNYYPTYGYMPGYPYNMDGYTGVPMVQEEKIKEERVKESPSPIIEQPMKAPAPIPNPIQVPNPGKVKNEQSSNKDKHQNENHQILKESIEIKNQMNPYNMYSRQPQAQQSHHNQREEDVRRFVIVSPGL